MSPEPRRRRPTIRDVADLAGVSHQTVSRYLRHDSGMKAATVERIEAAVQKLHYSPDLLARSMRTRRSETFAVVLPGWPAYVTQPELTAAYAVAQDEGFHVEIVIESGGSQARADRIDELLTGRRVDGVLCLAPIEGATATFGPDAPLEISPDFDDDVHNIGALADGSTAGEIVDHLARLGHRDFLHIAGASGFASARNRELAYAEAIARNGLVSHGTVGRAWEPEVAYAAVTALSDDTPITAVVAASDMIAVGAVRAALDRGWPVPSRLSVFGWDDVSFATYTSPSLSTVSVNRHLRGAYAMRRLVARVRDDPAPPAPTEPLNRIILRESTAPPGPR